MSNDSTTMRCAMNHDQNNTIAPATSRATEPYAEQYLEGRRSGLMGIGCTANPYFARRSDAAGRPESHEIWRSNYDVWRQGCMEGLSVRKREGQAQPSVGAGDDNGTRVAAPLSATPDTEDSS